MHNCELYHLTWLIKKLKLSLFRAHIFVTFGFLFAVATLFGINYPFWIWFKHNFKRIDNEIAWRAGSVWFCVAFVAYGQFGGILSQTFNIRKVHTSFTLAEYWIEVLNSGSRSLTSLSRISNITELLWILSDTVICKHKIRIGGVSVIILWPCFDSWCSY